MILSQFKKQTDAMQKQQGGPVARAAQPLPLYNVGLNYAGVSIKHVTFYQDFIVWQYFTPSFSGHYPSKTNKQKTVFLEKNCIVTSV